MIKDLIEQWLGEEKKDDLESSQSINESIIRINQLAGYNWALKDLKSRIPELEEMIVGEIESKKIVVSYKGGQCNGCFAMEDECVCNSYNQALDDIINSLKGDKE